jgi:integrase
VFQRTWSKATEEVGLPGMHFHDLRHAGATSAAIGGATLKELMEHLGHASARAAIIYQHAAADRGRKIADALTEQARQARSQDDGAREGHRGDGADEEE